MKTLSDFIVESISTSADIRELKKIKKQLTVKLRAQEDAFINNSDLNDFLSRNIRQLARTEGYHKNVVSLYLDKAEVNDLGTIPVPSHDKTKTHNAVPNWVKELEDNKKDKQILLIDFNGAKNDVLNACIPMVLKHEFAGVSIENVVIIGFGDVDDLPKELQSRFKPIINL